MCGCSTPGSTVAEPRSGAEESSVHHSIASASSTGALPGRRWVTTSVAIAQHSHQHHALCLFSTKHTRAQTVGSCCQDSGSVPHTCVQSVGGQSCCRSHTPNPPPLDQDRVNHCCLSVPVVIVAAVLCTCFNPCAPPPQGLPKRQLLSWWQHCIQHNSRHTTSPILRCTLWAWLDNAWQPQQLKGQLW